MKKSAALLTLFLLVIGSFAHAQTDWQEFFPLHIGDYWVYQETTTFSVIYTERVADKDTLENGQVYAKIHRQHLNSENDFFRRVDSLGDVYDYDFHGSERLLFKLNVCLGDSWPEPNLGGYWKVVERLDHIAENDTLTDLVIKSFESLAFTTYYISEGVGIVHIGFEGGDVGLLGALINGRLYGDTLSTKVSQQEKSVPDEFMLKQNYPNPFNTTTQINYYIKKGGAVKLEIYNIHGQMIRLLVNSAQAAGDHRVLWDGKDAFGNDAPSGVFFYRLSLEKTIKTRSLLILR